MKYHLFKKSRIYTGRPYCGPTSNNCPAAVDTIAQATAMKEIMTNRNPVGWDIFNSETKEKIL